MKKEKTIPFPQEENHLSFSFKESRFLDFISQYGRKFVILLLVILVSLILIYRMTSSKKTSAENDYFNADRLFMSLQKNIGINDVFEKESAKLIQIMERHPELHQKYDAPFAQMLIFQGNNKLAEEFANRALKRIKADDSSFYIDYAETTLLISEGHYHDALAKAKALKQRMDQSPQEVDTRRILFGDNLYTLNFIRIATLTQQIENKDNELLAWQELKQFLMQKPSSSVYSLIGLFGEGKVTLLDYINARESELKTKQS